MFIAELLIIAKIWKQPKCPSVDEWIKSRGTFTQWNITRSMKKKEILLSSDSTDGSGEHYVK